MRALRELRQGVDVALRMQRVVSVLTDAPWSPPLVLEHVARAKTHMGNVRKELGRAWREAYAATGERSSPFERFILPNVSLVGLAVFWALGERNQFRARFGRGGFGCSSCGGGR